MKKKKILFISSLLIVLIGGGLFLFIALTNTGDVPVVEEKEKQEPIVKNNLSFQTEEAKELTLLTQELLKDIQVEQRLNLTIVPKLNAFRNLLDSVNSYVAEAKQEVSFLKEINREGFQEDVILQAQLYSGKKAELVAQHLQEFNAGRVGAVLAKMKEKEASAVLDFWTGSTDPNINIFYRTVMRSYLQNKRQALHPELFRERSL